MKKEQDVIYQLNIEDIQEVAFQCLDRRLKKKELALVRDSVGEYIDWFQAIEHAINKHIDSRS